MVLEKLQRPDSDIPHMLHLGEEFDRAVGVPVASHMQPQRKPGHTILSMHMHACGR
jgi:hypothetical protein